MKIQRVHIQHRFWIFILEREQGRKVKIPSAPLPPFTFQILGIVCSEVIADLEGEISPSSKFSLTKKKGT